MAAPARRRKKLLSVRQCSGNSDDLWALARPSHCASGQRSHGKVWSSNREIKRTQTCQADNLCNPMHNGVASLRAVSCQHFVLVFIRISSVTSSYTNYLIKGRCPILKPQNNENLHGGDPKWLKDETLAICLKKQNKTVDSLQTQQIFCFVLADDNANSGSLQLEEHQKEQTKQNLSSKFLSLRLKDQYE